MSYIIIQITLRMMNDATDCNYFMIFIVVIMENNYQFSYDQFFLFYFILFCFFFGFNISSLYNRSKESF